MGRCRRGRRKGAGCVLKSHKLMAGNVLPLHSISEGTVVCNIKRHDGDCGVLARASADYAIVISHNADYGTSRIKLPSGARKIVPSCYCAEIRQVWSKRGSTEKSVFKAKNTFHYSLKRNTLPKVPGVTFNPEEFLHGGGNNQNNRHVSTVRQDASLLQKLSVRRTGCLNRQAAANRQVSTHGRTAMTWNPENYSLGKHQHIGHRTTARQDAPPTQKLLRRIRCLSRQAAANRQDGTPGRTAMMCKLDNYSLGKHQHIGHRTTAQQDAPPPQKLPIIRTGCPSRLAVANMQDGTPERTAMLWNPENYSLEKHQHIGHRTTARRDAPPGRKMGLIVRRRTERIRGQALVGRIGVFMASRATSSLCRQAVVASATDKGSLIFRGQWNTSSFHNLNC